MTQMEYPAWTKCNDGWKVRIPADLYENYSEAGEFEFPVMKKSGEIKRVNISKVSKPFTLDGKEYVLGTPAAERSQRRTYARRATSHRCEECGGRRNVHQAHDMSGITCWLCDKCDDGTASIA